MKSFIGVLLFCILIGCSIQEEQVRYDNYQVYQINVNSVEDVERLYSIQENHPELELDIWTTGKIGIPGFMDIMVSPKTKDFFDYMLDQFRLSYNVAIENVQENIDREAAYNKEMKERIASGDFAIADQDPNASFFQTYANFDEINDFVDKLHSQYPDLTQVTTIGNTYNGNIQKAIVITNTTAANDTPKIVYNGCQHAREWISPMTICYIANALLFNFTQGDSETVQMLNYFEYHLVPVVNGDGFLYTQTDRLWRKNRHQYPGNTCVGVDLNRNWGFHWDDGGASNSPCSDTYCGPSGFSEPESTNMNNYIHGLTNVVGYIDFHSYSQLFMCPWGYTGTKPPHNTELQSLMKDFTTAVYDTFKHRYDYGNIYDTIYPASGSSTDTVTGDDDVVYSFAIELRPANALGGGFQLPANEIIPQGIEIMAGVRSMANFIYLNPISNE